MLGAKDSNTSSKHTAYQGKSAVAPTVQVPVHAISDSSFVHAVLYKEHKDLAGRCNTVMKPNQQIHILTGCTTINNT